MGDKGLSEEDRVWVRDAIDGWNRSLEAADYDAWSTFWTEDGMIMPPGHPRVVGRQDMEAFLRDGFGDVRTIQLTDWTIEGSGDLAVVTTSVTWHTESAVGKEPVGTAKQMIELRKNSDGRWQIKTVIFNSDSS